MTVALGLLTYGVAAESDAFLDCFLEEPPAGVNPQDFLSSVMRRQEYWRVPVRLLLDAVARFRRPLPKLSGMALALLSVLVSRRPAAALLFTKPAEVERTMFEALEDIFRRVATTPCVVESRYGMGHLQDALPLLYHMCDYKQTVAQVKPRLDTLPAAVWSLTINLVHRLTGEDDPIAEKELNRPLQDLCVRYPELHGSGTRLSRCFGDCALLRDRPGSFTVGCLVEVLGRWESRGIPVAASRSPSSPPPEIAATLSPREIREYTDTAQQAFAEYEDRFDALVRRDPVLAFAKPIWAAIARGISPALPAHDNSFLRGPLHAHMKCSLPGCDLTTTERGKPLKLCGGSCGGLARYCSDAHFREHWPRHK